QTQPAREANVSPTRKGDGDNQMEERCNLCDELTGRAGRSDDSIYYELKERFLSFRPGDEVGPCCSECASALEQLDLVEV
ncbi:MAG: hypothetical protein MJA29_00930, partial [Candidatus Omnitrophica bacterium]|nr:hypothetical protein [Candidatus Omnitrophota bacterium]